MKVAVIINASAGAMARSEATSIRSSLAEAFRQHDIGAEMQFAEGSEIRETVVQALAATRTGKIDAVVIGGGDGTIRTAAGVLAGTGVRLGVLPLGTLNHFSKD